MGGSWWFRITVIMVALMSAIYVLLPSFLAESAVDRLAAQVEAVDPSEALADGEDNELPSWLPDTRINLGLDLQGGIDLTLKVDGEEAVLSSVGRDVHTVTDLVERNDIGILNVRRVRGEAAVEIQLLDEQDAGELKRQMATRFQGYRYVEIQERDDGTRWHLFELTDEAKVEVRTKAVEQAVEGLRSRVDATGVKEPSILRKGEDINVQLPGIENLQQAIDIIGTTAVLEFYLVDEDGDMAALTRALVTAEEEMGTNEEGESLFLDDQALNNWLLDNERISENQLVLWEYTNPPDGSDEDPERSEPHLLKEGVILTGDDINDASVQWDQMGDPNVSLEFKPAGGRTFADITGDNVGKRFAIVLDRKVRSAPVINEKISGGRAQITLGIGDPIQMQNDASVLALVLRTGALPAPVTVGQVQQVGAQLGADSITAGVRATMVGGLLVLVAMFLIYAKMGIVANMALTLNVTFILALLASLGATLTLPGIAGIALTVGMAVDANIIIYERIREELRLGKNSRSAVDSGFEHALSAVLDANITTGIAGVVLYSYGTGPIKGFAVTLLIGIVTTLFTAIFCSRTFMDFMVRKSSTRLVM